MIDSVFLCYKTDAQHSYSSRDIIGIGTDRGEAIEICRQKAFKEGSRIDSEQLWNLINLLQTQGYVGEGEFQIESVFVNQLL